MILAAHHRMTERARLIGDLPYIIGGDIREPALIGDRVAAGATLGVGARLALGRGVDALPDESQPFPSKAARASMVRAPYSPRARRVGCLEAPGKREWRTKVLRRAATQNQAWHDAVTQLRRRLPVGSGFSA
jgi:hypothetical protein